MTDQDTVQAELRQLVTIMDQIPGMAEAFKTRVESQPHAAAGFETDAQKKFAQSEAKDRLKNLSRQRADVMLNEMGAAITLSMAASSWVILVILHRAALYDDADISLCIDDINHHKDLAAWWIERARELFPAAQSHFIEKQDEQVALLDAGLNEALNAQQKMLGQLQNMISVQGDKGASTPPDPDAKKRMFEDFILLGRLNRDLVAIGCARIHNIFGYVDLINESLIPLEMGDSQDWALQKIKLLQEALTTFDAFSVLLDAAKDYFTRTANLSVLGD